MAILFEVEDCSGKVEKGLSWGLAGYLSIGSPSTEVGIPPYYCAAGMKLLVEAIAISTSR